MTRSELALEVAKRSGVSIKESERIIRVIIETLEESLSRGEKVTLSGFGTFERRTRKASVARNPSTGELMRVARQNVAAFRAGARLKGVVNGQ